MKNIKSNRHAQQRAERTRKHVDCGIAKARRMGFNVIEAPAAFDDVMDDDRAFFNRAPSRSYRVRITTPAELEVERIVGVRSPPPPAGHRSFTIVHNVASGQRHRQTVNMPADMDCDMSEAAARALWERVVHHGSAADHLANVAAEHLRPRDGSAVGQIARDCLCIRLPIAAGAYSSELAAVEALEGFAATAAADAGMGRPLVVGTGDAVYGVWRFVRPVPIGAWVAMAPMVEGLAQAYGLHLDGPVTSAAPFDVDELVPGILQEHGK